MAPSLRCPRCGTVVTVAAGQPPVCPACGFSGPAPAAAPAPAAPAAAPAPAPYVPTLGTPAGSAYMVPDGVPTTELPPPGEMPPAAAPAARGKVVAPGLVVLFHIITLGIYFFVFWWRTSREADEATGARHAHPITKAGVWLAVIGIVLVAVGAIVALVAVADTLLENSEDETYTEEQFLEDVLAAGIAAIATIAIGALMVLAGRICMFVGQYRTWKATRNLEVAMGDPKPLPPGIFLAIAIVAFLLGGGNSSGGAEGAVNGLLSLLALAAYLTIAALTQSHLNRVWQGRPADPAWAPPAPQP